MGLHAKTGGLILAMSCGLGAAQDYRLDWFTMDAGGGASTGGVYQIVGTLGQPDATGTRLTGGTYALEGGLWPGLVLAGSGDVPALRIEPRDGGVVISWPSAAGEFTLEEAPNLHQDEWLPSSAGNGVWIPATERTIFYRLSK
jgi:hypothetical protein